MLLCGHGGTITVRRGAHCVEARATGAAAQLHSAIAELESKLEAAKAAKDTRKVKEFTESLAARKAWLKQIEAVAR